MIFPIYIVDNQTIYKHRLWFDVEQIQETTIEAFLQKHPELWFDVEQIQETTVQTTAILLLQLWFDVEQIQETTICDFCGSARSCGLM